MEKTATSDNYISNHFPDTKLLCSLLVQKQESREMAQTNLMGLIRNNQRGGTRSLLSLDTTVRGITLSGYLMTSPI